MIQFLLQFYDHISLTLFLVLCKAISEGVKRVNVGRFLELSFVHDCVLRSKYPLTNIFGVVLNLN